MEFSVIRKAVAVQFGNMSKDPKNLFRVDISGDDIWDLYLKSFPEGTNPIHIERTQHDCSACRQFIKSIGNVVQITDDYQIVSIWDTTPTDTQYDVVLAALSDAVHAAKIIEQFRSILPTAGQSPNYAEIMLNGKPSVIMFEHFFANIPSYCITSKACIGSVLGEHRTTHEMFEHTLRKMTTESLDIVLELIDQNSIYRGQEFKSIVTQFRSFKERYDQVSETLRPAFVWYHAGDTPLSVTRCKNTVIGTLLMDLSEGMELDTAVASYESKVAPTNYKRPTAIVTKGMIENAKTQINELGLMSALSRRFATENDVPVTNVLFVDRTITTPLATNVFDTLISQTPVKLSNTIEQVSLTDFISKVLPSINSMELLVENKLVSNLMSMTTATDPTANQLFKWDNPVAWSYNGNVTDSIKERVAKAGGNVTAELCCRLSWCNTDDLDIHMREPNGSHIHFGNKLSLATGGQLDIDMNASVANLTNAPVENIFYPRINKMTGGKYQLYVNNYHKRDMDNPGFVVEIECRGHTYRFEYPKPVKHGELILVAELHYDPTSDKLTIDEKIKSSVSSVKIWNISTNTFVKVRSIVSSPNHWGEKQTGNLHYFFILDKCINNTACRGFYNEYLRDNLTPHRKAFEMVGANSIVAPSDDQMSGVGISTTNHGSITVKVTGKFTRTLEIMF